MAERWKLQPPENSHWALDARTTRQYFMGGASAGEVLRGKSQVVTFVVEGQVMQQVSLEFFADPDDLGDIGELPGMATEEGLLFLKYYQETAFPRLGTMPHYRTFTYIEGEGLFASLKPGMIFKHHQTTPELREMQLVTADAHVAQVVFEMLRALALNSKGRQLYQAVVEYVGHGSSQ